jgi:hypothetical protein
VNNHTSPCEHMTPFVAKSPPERTRVPRRVTGRLTVRCLVNISPGRPRTSSTAAPRNPQHHHRRSLRSESKSFFFLKRTHGVKRAIQEVGNGRGVAAPARLARGGEAGPTRRAGEGAAAPARQVRGGEATSARRGEAAPTEGGEAAPGARWCCNSWGTCVLLH